VPDDVSVVGYDDSLSIMQSDVKLTTILHPKRRWAFRRPDTW
jgi:DNA-binding LacI/PurR family transcriptional regulator